MLKQLNQVLALFSTNRTELSVIEAATLVRWPRSTTYRLMAQFEKARFLDRDDETGRYRLGIRLSWLGELAQRSTSLQRIAQPVLLRLSRQTGETATLLVLADGEGTAVLHSEGSHRVVAKGLLGRYWPLHASAGGKALLAWLPEEERRPLLKKARTKYTPTTITGDAVLTRELKQVRERGYSTVRGEFMDDVWGAAVPVFNHRNELVAAITLGGPRSRVTVARLPELGHVLIAAGEGVSRSLGYEDEYPREGLSHSAEGVAEGEGSTVAPAASRLNGPKQAARIRRR